MVVVWAYINARREKDQTDYDACNAPADGERAAVGPDRVRPRFKGCFAATNCPRASKAMDNGEWTRDNGRVRVLCCWKRVVMLSCVGQVMGLVIVDHGSKRAEANEMLLDVAAMFKRVSGNSIVEAAHMELAEPTIEQAFDRCVAQGATMVVVHPYFLSPGRHSTTDIPRMVEEARAKHPGVKVHVTQPLGLDEKMCASDAGADWALFEE